MGSKRPLKHRICFITSSKEIKKMRNPRRLCSVNRKPIHCAGWAQLCGGVGRKGKGSGSSACTFPSHPWWSMRPSPAALQTQSTQCTFEWTKQRLQSALIPPGSARHEGLTKHCLYFKHFQPDQPSAHKAASVRVDSANWNDSAHLPGFLQQFPSISSLAFKYHWLSAQW